MSRIKPLGLLAAVGAIAAIACSDTGAEPSRADVVQPRLGVELGEVEIRPKPDEPTTDPVNQCPTPFSLLLAKGTEADDSNGDFWVCGLKTSSGDLVVIDNNIPPGQIGECPDHFVLAKITLETEARDRNGNHLLCVLKSENANAVIDDNHKPKD